MHENIKKLKHYNFIRHNPINGSSNLSAYNKFGCFSIRELYEHIKKTLGTCKGSIALIR